MQHCWFKVWLVGSNGAHQPEYFFWPSYLRKEREEMMMKIEHELGPFCEGIRSVNWQVAKKPPIRVLEDRVKVLKAKRKYYLEEIKVHQKTLDKHTK